MLYLLHSFGREDDSIYIKNTRPDDPNLEGRKPHIIVYHKPYEEFYSKHREEFVRRATDTVERILGRKLTSDERRKLERAFELAVEYGKRFHDIYRGVGEDVYDRTATAAKVYRTEGYRSVEHAEKTLGIDFLEKVGDIILEINHIIPGITKPEEIYGDRWYEFLKKKGIDPKTLEPVSGDNQRKGPADGGKSALPPEVLAIAKGLEFSDFSENVMKKAEEELLKLIDELLENEANALQLFHAVRLLRLVQKRDRNGIKKFGG